MCYWVLKDKKVLLVFCRRCSINKGRNSWKSFNEHLEKGNAATLLTSMVEDPTGYGRVVRDGDEVLKIVEHKDCSQMN